MPREALALATLVRQDPELKSGFYRVIEEAARQRRADAVDGIRATHPVIGTLLTPLARFMRWNQDLDKDLKGMSGETVVSRALRRLPAAWYYLNNVVLLREPDGYAQIDHVAVGPSGVYAIETKQWSGAILGKRDTWRMKQNGGGWQRVKSPTTQSKWHADRIRSHLEAHGVSVPVTPVVVFVDSDWVRWEDCTGRIYDGVGKMREALARSTGDLVPSDEQRRQIAERIALGVPRTAPDMPPEKSVPAMSAAPGVIDLPPVAPSNPVAEPVNLSLDPSALVLATAKQRNYVRELLTRAGQPFAEERIERLSRSDAQVVIDRLRFHRSVDLPPLN